MKVFKIFQNSNNPGDNILKVYEKIEKIEERGEMDTYVGKFEEMKIEIVKPKAADFQ